MRLPFRLHASPNLPTLKNLEALFESLVDQLLDSEKILGEDKNSILGPFCSILSRYGLYLYTHDDHTDITQSPIRVQVYQSTTFS